MFQGWFMFQLLLVSVITGPALSWSFNSQSNRLYGSVARASINSRLDSSLGKVIRHNPMTDKFPVESFHHLEFYCSDATTAFNRFSSGLGMNLIAKSDQSTGNNQYLSFCLNSGDVNIVFTSPNNLYIRPEANPTDLFDLSLPFPLFSSKRINRFISQHGTGVGVVALTVSDVEASYASLLSGGARSVAQPHIGSDKQGSVMMAEVVLYGDTVLRLVDNSHFHGTFLPNFHDVEVNNNNKNSSSVFDVRRRVWRDFGLRKLDHVVGNVPNLASATKYIKRMTGFHEFAEFTAAEVGTVDSGLNSVVLANNKETVLLPVNEPTHGTRRKSQIQTYLEQNQGPGVQHLALATDDLVSTVRQIHLAGGFEFLSSQPASYYQDVRRRLGTALTEQQYQEIEELGILADSDGEGVLLQIFTKPIGDRSTLFLEFIQRIGCLQHVTTDREGEKEGEKEGEREREGEGESGKKMKRQSPACGGFGKGNFKALFQSIENYEKSQNL